MLNLKKNVPLASSSHIPSTSIEVCINVLHTMAYDNSSFHNLTNVTEAESPEFDGDRVEVESNTCVFIGLAVSVLSLAANIAVLIVLHRKGRHRTVFDLSIASLTVTDLLVSLCFFVRMVPTIIEVVFSNFIAIVRETIMPLAVKTLASLFLISLLHILFITFQRLFAILYPFKCRQFMTKKVVKFSIAVIWLISLCTTPVLFIKFPMNKLFGVIIFTTGGIIFAAYTIIAVKICMMLRKNDFEWRKEHRVLLNSFGVTVSFFASLSPAGYYFAQNNEVHIDCLLMSMSMNFLLDPLLYFYFSYWLSKRDERRARRDERN